MQCWREGGEKGIIRPDGTFQGAALGTQHSKDLRGSTYWLQEFLKLAFKCWDVFIEMLNI